MIKLHHGLLTQRAQRRDKKDEDQVSVTGHEELEMACVSQAVSSFRKNTAFRSQLQPSCIFVQDNFTQVCRSSVETSIKPACICGFSHTHHRVS
jgi:hypothetical protein